MNFLSIEELKELNNKLEEDNKLFIVEELHYNKNGYNLKLDPYNDTIICMTNLFDEAFETYKEHCKMVDLNAKYYEVFISRAYTTDNESVQHHQLQDYTFHNCLPSSDKSEADYLKINEYYSIDLLKGDYSLFDNMNVNHEHHETLEGARGEALQLFKHFYYSDCEWWGIRLDIDFVREELDQYDNIIKQTHKTVESHYKGVYFDTLFNTKNRGVFVCINETGDIIDEVKTVQEGINLIFKYETDDIKDGSFEPNFYSLCDCEGCIIEL